MMAGILSCTHAVLISNKYCLARLQVSVILSCLINVVLLWQAADKCPTTDQCQKTSPLSEMMGERFRMNELKGASQLLNFTHKCEWPWVLFNGVMCRCISVWEGSVCPFEMTQIAATATVTQHCQKENQERGEMERKILSEYPKRRFHHKKKEFDNSVDSWCPHVHE